MEREAGMLVTEGSVQGTEQHSEQTGLIINELVS